MVAPHRRPRGWRMSVAYERQQRLLRERRAYLDLAEKLAEGDAFEVDAREFSWLFGGGGILGGGKPEDSFLSSCIGSGCGRIRCRFDDAKGCYIVSKHPEDSRGDGLRYHVDADRQFRYTRRPDGMWEPRK